MSEKKLCPFREPITICGEICALYVSCTGRCSIKEAAHTFNEILVEIKKGNEPAANEVKNSEEHGWIKVTHREPTSEERCAFYDREFLEVPKVIPVGDEDMVIPTCKMPHEGEDILVMYNDLTVDTDTCGIDNGGYLLEISGNDWFNVKAWMPIPKYEEEK